jgi:transcriptional regulator with XRE-family HTH domain
MEIFEVKKGFVKRLREEMLKRGFDADGRGVLSFANKFGIKASSLHAWLKERNLPNAEQLINLCDKLNCSADYLLFGIEIEKRRTIRREEDQIVHNLLKILQIPNQEFTLKVTLESLNGKEEK